jgi:glucokinase
MILAGDIGGTKTVLALFDDEGPAGGPAVRQEVFPSRDFPTFAAVLAAFLPRPAEIRVCADCIGVAGPVLNGQSRTTNLPWVLDERELGKTLSTERVRLLNDVEAAAFGMRYLTDHELCVLQAGNDRRKGHACLLAVGTGLGQALLFWDGARYHPMASEGGHADFAPQSEMEMKLLAYLREQQRRYLRDGTVYTVTDDPPGPPTPRRKE